jgi:DNA-binding transcriptional ArsR family regulator
MSYGLTPYQNFYNQLVMEQIGYSQQAQNLDAVFAALADPTRRAMLTRLAEGQASVGELAAPFQISQPAISKHLKVLEKAGLVERAIDEQRRPARLKAEPMAEAVEWMSYFRRFWGDSFDQLDELLVKLQAQKQGGQDE